jgi:hypothetical protein
LRNKTTGERRWVTNKKVGTPRKKGRAVYSLVESQEYTRQLQAIGE